MAGRLAVTETDVWLTRLEKTGSRPLADAAAEPASAAEAVLLRPGDRPPDRTLTDAGGQSISLPSSCGAAVAITFIYTRCPLPDFCPLLDRRFVEGQRAVNDDPALKGRVHLLSVSFDPDTDTAAVFRAHAAR